MKLKDKYFPYPVIKPDLQDYQSTTFNTSVKTKVTDKEITLLIEFNLDNIELSNLILRGDARFVIHLEESRTMFREVYQFNDLKNEIVIPSDKIRNNIELTSFIIANDDIVNFNSKDLDLIYRDITVSYDKYNIIGLAQSMDIKVLKENDDIKEISSIFSIIPSTDEDRFYNLKLTKENIIIEIPKDDFTRYNYLGNTFKAKVNEKEKGLILMTLVLIPPFIEALNLIKEDPESYQTSLWYNSLILAFKRKEIELEEEFKSSEFSSYYLSQVIFEDVISNSMKGLVDENDL